MAAAPCGRIILLCLVLGAASIAAGGEKMEYITLPEPLLKGKMSVEEAIQKRRSVRSFDSRALSLETISQLLWATQGITEPTYGLRSAPSAGALYPLELYLVKSDGVYHYIPRGHKLERIGQRDVRSALARAALGQGFIAEAPVSIVIAAVASRTTRKYGSRGVRYVHMEVGYAAENLHLQGVALGLGSVSVGAFHDSEVAKVLGLPKEEEPLIIVPLGYPR